MKKIVFVFVLAALGALASAQQKFALVIGNGNYTNLTKLANPVNDANDMEAALISLGFTVDKVLNGSLDRMESAAVRLGNRLASSSGSYGFLFYAGHGVQSAGENYLIPADANIASESFLRQRAVSVQTLLDELNAAGNALNVVVLDACRDNPFGWSRSGNRGLSVVSRQPADSIVVYATSAGSTAADGTGRNGLFTGHLLSQIKTPGLEVREVFQRAGAAVSRASGRTQNPAIYDQFYGKAYLAGTASPPPAQAVTPTPAPRPAAVQPAPRPAPAVTPAPRPAVQPAPAVTRITGTPSLALTPGDMEAAANALVADCLNSQGVPAKIMSFGSMCAVKVFENRSSIHIDMPAFYEAVKTAVRRSRMMTLASGGINPGDKGLYISGSVNAVEDRTKNTTVRTYFIEMMLINAERGSVIWIGTHEIRKALP